VRAALFVRRHPSNHHLVVAVVVAVVVVVVVVSVSCPLVGLCGVRASIRRTRPFYGQRCFGIRAVRLARCHREKI
jgi:hypothetical protein